GESDKRRIGPRIQFAYSGLFYGAIAYSFAKPFFNTSSSSEGESQKAALGMLLEKDWGIWIVWILAIGMAGNAVWRFYLGISGIFMIQIDENPDSKNEYKLVKRSGRYGYVARGVVFGVRSEEHTSELQSRENLVCRLLLERKQIPF